MSSTRESCRAGRRPRRRRAALTAVPAGDLVTGDATATVKVPPAPDTDADGRRDPGGYTLRLTPPDGAPFLPAAALTYR